MPLFRIDTEEHVHGVYHIEAESEEEARRKLESNPHDEGEQMIYEAIFMEVEKVEKIP